MGMSYDEYHQLARLRAASHGYSFEAREGAVVAQMAETLHSIHDQMEFARRQNAEALAYQQALLNHEALQCQIEELIYRSEKLVAQCSSTDSDFPLSSRYYLLLGVLGKIDRDGIATPMIRGRENKAAFERVVEQVRALKAKLEGEPEVQEAIQWAKKLDEQRAQKRHALEQKMSPLRSTRESLERSKNAVSFQDAAHQWPSWVQERIPKSFHVPLLVCFALAALMVFPLIILIPSVLIDIQAYRERLNKELNVRLDKEIAAVDDKLRALQAEKETA